MASISRGEDLTTTTMACQTIWTTAPGTSTPPRTDYDSDGCRLEDTDDDNDGITLVRRLRDRGAGQSSGAATDHDSTGADFGGPGRRQRRGIDSLDSCTTGELGWTSDPTTASTRMAARLSEDTDDDATGLRWGTQPVRRDGLDGGAADRPRPRWLPGLQRGHGRRQRRGS